MEKRDYIATHISKMNKINCLLTISIFISFIKFYFIHTIFAILRISRLLLYDPISIKVLSITDDLVTVNFAPQDCQAVNIIQEYWSGTLNFTADTLFSVSLPDFYNYTFTAELNSSILDLGNANKHNKDQRLCAYFYDES